MNDTSLSEYSRAMLVMVVLGLLCMTFLLVPVSAGSAGERLIAHIDKNSVMKGESFSVSVIGRPNASYLVWVKGTSSMTGGYDNQPPMVGLFQSGVANDTPWAGIDPSVAYPIGQYMPQNMFRVLRQDVALESTTGGYNRTRYYARITTGSTGTGTVEFVTTDWTKAQTYTIHVEQNFGLSWMPDYRSADVYVNVGTDTPVPAWAHTISGTIFNHAPGDTVQILAFDQIPVTWITPVANTSITAGDQFTLSVPTGIYWLNAYIDRNGNGYPDSDEPGGWAINKTGKHIADPIFVFHDRDNLSITLTTRFEKPAGTGVNLTYNYGKVNTGTGFSLTVQGQPGTVYWLWVKNGTEMPVDPFWQWNQNYRPPVIIPDQPGVILDNNVTPAVGIGGYVPNGSSQTVYDLVPHGFENGSRYYAKVLTNESGFVTIPWETSIKTKAQPYTFRVENHSVAYGNYTFDEAWINVLPGSFTLLAPGDGSFTLGDEIRLMGTSTMTDTVYFFLTGPNLWPEGSRFYPAAPYSLDPRRNPLDTAVPASSIVVNGVNYTFVVRAVYADNTWDWKWGTASYALDPGTYTIYAVSAPLDANNLNVIYANYTFLIKDPFITASADPAVAIRENSGLLPTKSLFIRGVATGSPQMGVAMWMLGPNFANRWSTNVNPDGRYEFELINGTILSMTPGRYHVIVQHPMRNQVFDIALCAGSMTQVCNLQQASGVWGGQSIFTILGMGSLNSEEAYQALLNAIGDVANDDISTKLDFDVVENGSAPPPANSISIAPGWNFISVPKKLAAGSDTASAVFAGVNTEVHTIWKYNSSAGAWYNMTAGDRVEPLYGIWIFSDRSVNIPLVFDTTLPEGPVFPEGRTLYPGWNAIGSPAKIQISAHDAFTQLDNAWSMTLGFNPETRYLEPIIIRDSDSSDFGDSRLLEPGKGYWILISSQKDLWALP